MPDRAESTLVAADPVPPAAGDPDPGGAGYRRIAGLAAPIALANAFALGSQWVIVVLIGRFGADALYVRSLYLPVSFIFAAVQVGIEVSTLVAVARYRAGHGADPGRLSTVVRPLALLGGAVMAVAAATIAIGTGPLGELLGVTADRQGLFGPFIRWMCAAVVIEVPGMVLTATLRGWGRTGAASVVSVAVMVTQVLGVAAGGGRLGVFALPWAVAGSAVVSTVLSGLLLRRSGLLAGVLGAGAGRQRFSGLRAAAAVAASVGVPVGGTFVLLCLVNGATLRVLDRFGPAAVAGFAIANATQTVVIVPAMGLGTAVAILVNQGAGADRGGGILRTVRRGLVIAVAGYAPVGVGLWWGAGRIADFAAPDAAVAAVVASYLRLVGPTLALVGIMLAMLTLLEQIGSGFLALSVNIGYFTASVGLGAALAFHTGQYRSFFAVMAGANGLALLVVTALAAYRVRRRAARPVGHG